MKALASIPIFVYILFCLPNSSDSCCCDMWSEFGEMCYCNMFGCNCGECLNCPPTIDGFCYYEEVWDNPFGCIKSSEKACARFWSRSLSGNSTNSTADPLHIFKTLDIDRNGYISTDEFNESRAFLKTFRDDKTYAAEIFETETLFNELDMNNNGMIEPKEIDNTLDDDIDLFISIS